MNTLTSFVKRHSLVTFFVLAYALSWVWVVFPDSPFYPTGPLFAAVIVLAFTGGWAGVRDLLSRIVRWRAGLRWYAAALGLPVIVVSLAVLLNILLGAPAPSAAQLAGWPMLVVPFIFRFVLIGMGEEPGWRGFALPRLQSGRSALAASLVLGLIWAGWHIPQFILDDGFNLIAWAPKILSTVIVSVVMAWIFNNTNGSVLMTALAHASYSTIGNQFFFQMFSGSSRVRLDWLDVAIWAVVAAGVVLIAGSEHLSRRPLAALMESAPTGQPLARENPAQ